MSINNPCPTEPKLYDHTALGKIYQGDSRWVLQSLPEASVDLIITSPPFPLIKKKAYGNVDAQDYLQWFKPFAEQCYRVLKPSGSFVVDTGGVWNCGLPTRHLYQ